MKIKSYLYYATVFTVAFFVSAVVSYNVTPEKTPQHTSTVSGSSGDLKCTSSCVVKEND